MPRLLALAALTLALLAQHGPARAAEALSLTPVEYFGPSACTTSGCTAPACSEPTCAAPSCRSACDDDGCCSSERLFGLFRHSDHRFDCFISPMTNPVFFEDPRNVTEARVIFLNHRIPTAVLGGGNIQLLAVQLRASLTERLSLIATKDGYIFTSGDAPDIDGFANVALGLKYNLFVDPDMQRLLSVGARAELPTGTYRALQGNSATTVFDLFLTGGTQVGDLAHFLSSPGIRIPADHNQQNGQFYWSNHIDRRLRNRPLYGLAELNWYHWYSNGNSALPVGGLDLYNFGSNAVAGTNVVTGALGVKYKPTSNLELGVCYEIPLTSNRDILQNRVTGDLIWRY